MRRSALLLFLLLSACGDGPSTGAPREAPPAHAAETVPVPGVDWARVSAAQLERATFLGVPAAFENARGMRFVFVPSGVFPMGSPDDEPGHAESEQLHEVSLTLGYYLQTTPVTAAQFGGTGSGWATNVSHAEAASFAAVLGAEDPDWSYRLPSEAEWEYACRAGATTAYPWGPDAVGATDAPNPWGLSGLAVGIREWVRDRFGPLPSWAVGDPLGPRAPEGSGYVVRGGGTRARPARCAQRAGLAGTSRAPDLGFRLVVPVGYGLGAYGSVAVTFRLTDPMGGAGEAAPDAAYDLRIVKMNDRLSARMAGTELEWQRVERPSLPVTLRMVPGKYYVYAEAHRKGALVRGREIKFHAWGQAVDVPVPIPERDLRRYGSGSGEKPQ